MHYRVEEFLGRQEVGSYQQLWKVMAHRYLVFIHPANGVQQAGQVLLGEREVQVTFPAILQNTETP